MPKLVIIINLVIKINNYFPCAIVVMIMSTEENRGERQHLLVDLTSVGPEDVVNIQSPPNYTG